MLNDFFVVEPRLMVKHFEASEPLWDKIRIASDLLHTDSPSKIAKAILNGRNPPTLTFDALRFRVQRFFEKRSESGEFSGRSPGSGRPITVTTNKNLGRVKKMMNRSCRGIEVYTEGVRAQTISKSSAKRLKKKAGFSFRKYTIVSVQEPGE